MSLAKLQWQLPGCLWGLGVGPYDLSFNWSILCLHPHTAQIQPFPKQQKQAP